MTKELQELLQALCLHSRVIVTGPQRSGTTIAAKILAQELKREVVLEEDIEVRSLWKAFELFKSKDKFVLQAPALCPYTHLFPEGTAIVMIRRNLDEVRASMERIQWQHEKEELDAYFMSAGSVAEVKYAVWDNYQKKKVSGFNLSYNAMLGHPLWVQSEDRKKFKSRQTDYNPRVGIVIGHYNSIDALNLNVAAIRKNCGDAPILISDDASPGFGSTPTPGSTFDRVVKLSQVYKNVHVWPNPDRIGHAGGDMAAFWKAIIWGKNLELDVVYKLSQRYIIDIPDWAVQGAKDLIASGRATLGRDCKRHGWKIRTEAVGLLIKDWYDQDILAHLTPRKIGCATEPVIWDDIKVKLGAGFCQWGIMSPARDARAPNILFRESNSAEEYYQLANKLGVKMNGAFNTVTSPKQPNYQLG